ncbi:hypothetical protein V9T40_005033 [Parthenolecanium corni]|uniref:Uncharacterized protein n=1 Tax=Parthenolecanium corni TaxID=536013 RepID=A0AAN9Y3N1_9HEMI
MGTRQPHLIHRDRGRALAFTAAENTRCDPPPMMTMVEKNERRGQRGERMAEEGCGGAVQRPWLWLPKSLLCLPSPPIRMLCVVKLEPQHLAKPGVSAASVEFY